MAGEQVTPGAPWQIRITDELRARFVERAPLAVVYCESGFAEGI